MGAEIADGAPAPSARPPLVALADGVPGNPPRVRGVREAVRDRVVRLRAKALRPVFAVVLGGLRSVRSLGPPWFLKMLAHPQWLFESDIAIPHRPVTLYAPQAPEETQLELCRRIIDAYAASRDSYGDLSEIWSGKLLRYYAPLQRALDSRDAAAVNEQLRWMFRRPFLAGIATPIDYEDPGSPWVWSLMTYNSLVSLAEGVGAIRVETPEQGIVGRVFAEGVDGLPARIERELGVSLDFPLVGAPYGILIGERLITRETGRHLGAAVRLHQSAELHLGRRPGDGRHVVEIGGGFGGAALWYVRLLGDAPGSYTVVDLPLMNAFQAYFLGCVYGAGALGLYGEDSQDARIAVMPPAHLAQREQRTDVVFNQDSFPEMTESAARAYLSWMTANVTGLFVSCNQEVGTHGAVEQQVVGELVAGYDGIERLSRDPSWTRKGYVEEVYRCSAPRAG